MSVTFFSVHSPANINLYDTNGLDQFLQGLGTKNDKLQDSSV